MQTTFELTDAKGNAHQYRVTLHPGSEGCLIAHELTSEIVEPAVKAIGDLIASGGDIDHSHFAPHLATLLRTLDPKRQSTLLKYTVRDGEPLAEKANFNRAYEGNYGEWMEALIRVVLENQFVPLDYILRKVKHVLENPEVMESAMEKLAKILPAQDRANLAEGSA